MKKAPSAFGASPKYDNENVVCGFSLPLVGFEGELVIELIYEHWECF